MFLRLVFERTRNLFLQKTIWENAKNIQKARPYFFCSQLFLKKQMISSIMEEICASDKNNIGQKSAFNPSWWFEVGSDSISQFK